MTDWAISVKGVLGPPGAVVLLHNERDEWELPGGRLEAGDESPEQALSREIHEELGLHVSVDAGPVRAWIYEPIPGRSVVIVTYSCRLVGGWPEVLTPSDEHDDARIVPVGELDELTLPEGYRLDIEAAERLRG